MFNVVVGPDPGQPESHGLRLVRSELHGVAGQSGCAGHEEVQQLGRLTEHRTPVRRYRYHISLSTLDNSIPRVYIMSVE
jgi:hypothetical protein